MAVDPSAAERAAAPDRVRKRTPGQVTKGDGTVGKTTLLLSYITHAFITEYTPTVFDNFSAIEEIDGQIINCSGQDDYQSIRQTCYTYANYDLFLLCFSVVHHDSFDNVRYKWVPELKKNAPNTPLVLVGTKTDLRDEKDKHHISVKDGEKRAKEVKAKMYLECSSKQPESISKMMVGALSVVMERDALRRQKIEKQYKKEKKEEEKMEKKLKKLEAEQREKEAKEKEKEKASS